MQRDKSRYMFDVDCAYCGKTTHRYIPPSRQQPRYYCNATCRNRQLGKDKAARGRAGLVCPVCGHYGPRRAEATCTSCLALDKSRPVRPWTDEDIAYLTEHYPAEGAEVVAEALARDHVAVRDKANKLGLTLTNEAARRIIYDQSAKRMRENNPMNDPESRAKTLAWQAEHIDEVLERLMAGKARHERQNPTELEQRLHDALDGLGMSYTVAERVLPRFIVDVRVEHLIIQIDGDYWHGHPRYEPLTERQQAQQARDARCDSALRALGYSVVRIWESDFDEDLVKAILMKHDLIAAA